MKVHWIAVRGLTKDRREREGEEGEKEGTEGGRRGKERGERGKGKKWRRTLGHRQIHMLPCTMPRLATLMPSNMQMCGVGSLGELTVRGVQMSRGRLSQDSGKGRLDCSLTGLL